jgi:hypothetical protein
MLRNMAFVRTDVSEEPSASIIVRLRVFNGIRVQSNCNTTSLKMLVATSVRNELSELTHVFCAFVFFGTRVK